MVDAANAIGNMKSSTELLVQQLKEAEGLGFLESSRPPSSDESLKSGSLECMLADFILLLSLLRS